MPTSSKPLSAFAATAAILALLPLPHAAGGDLPPAPVPATAIPAAAPAAAPAPPIAPATPAWDYSSLSLWRTLAAPARVDVVAVSPDGTTVAAGTNGRVLLWNMAGDLLGSLVDPSVAAISTAPDVLRAPIKINDWVNVIAYSPEGKYIATASSANPTIRIWDSANRSLVRVLSGHHGRVDSIAWSADGKLLASGSEDKMVKLWDPFTGRLINTFTQHVYPVKAVGFSPDGAVVVSLGVKNRGRKNGELKFWDSVSGKLWKEALLENLEAANATVSTGGRIVASGTILPSGVTLWDALTGVKVRSVKLPRGLDLPVVGIAFSSDARVVAAVTAKRGRRGKDSTVILWQVQTGALLKFVAGAPATSLAFSPDGRVVVTGGDNKTVQLFRVP